MLNIKKKAIYSTAQKTIEARHRITASFLLNTFISKYANNINYSTGKAPLGLENEYGKYISMCPPLPHKLPKMFFLSISPFCLMFYFMDESKDDYTFPPLR